MKLTIWRLIPLETHDAFMNMAIDEAILRARVKNSAPNTLRLYRWKPSAVSIGKFQTLTNEVRLEKCRESGVDIVRRVTGGGTVYHDAEDEITYSVVADKQDLGVMDIAEVYRQVYLGLAETLKVLGVASDFNMGSRKACPNLTVNGRKISGSAQCHKSGVVLQHGTLLLRVNLDKMFDFLRVPWAKTCTEVVEVARRKITSIADELGRNISTAEVNQALTKGFEKALNTRIVDGQLTLAEKTTAEELYREKYICDDWNLSGKAFGRTQGEISIF
jgi:lipoate-protein ligase A